MTIRNAVIEDLGAIVDIYNHYVTETHVTFDTEPFTPASRLTWFEQFDGHRYRCIVAESDGALMGYASSVAFKSKPAYETSVEVSVYLAPEATGQGLGGALYERLLPELGKADLHRAYAGIALPNDASVALHSRFGFLEAAKFEEVGRKFGRNLDVELYELVLEERASERPERGEPRNR